jgi:hypothetical protein
MRKLLIALVSAAVLAGCATNAFRAAELQPGASRQDVLARLGPPTRVVAIPGGGERLQYSLQPYGQFAWMVDLDGSGRVQRVRQVMDGREFTRIVPGQWTREDVEREFGPPARIEGTRLWPGPVLTYRWRDADRSDMFWWVYLDERNVVRQSHQGMEFINAPSDDRS